MLNYSQHTIVGFRNKHLLSRDSGDAMLAMITDPRFRAEDVDSKTIAKLEALLEVGYGKDIWEHCRLHDPIDGEQDLKMYMLSIKGVVAELFGDPKFTNKMVLTFTPTYNKAGERTIGSAMGGVWAQVNAYATGTDKVLLAMAIFIDGIYSRVNMSLKPMYCKFPVFPSCI
jgi:hypothetical protein